MGEVEKRPEWLEEALGRRFERPEFLNQALIHSSTAGDRAGRAFSNERLEFLGDRVLGLIAARLVYERFPNEEEGALARRHTALVRREALAEVARSIGLSECMVLSPAEEESGGRNNPGILSDTCEAVIAALYLDGGLEAAESFIRRYWEPLMETYVAPPIDAKTALQEWAQGRSRPLPIYRETGRTGPPHAPTFSIEVSVEGLGSATAEGPSKRAAEQAAAALLLKQAGADKA